MDTPTQQESLKNGAIDIGVLLARREYPEGVDAVVVYVEQLTVTMADNHFLCLKGELLPQALAGESFIIPLLDEKEGFSAILQDLARQGGLPDRP